MKAFVVWDLRCKHFLSFAYLTGYICMFSKKNIHICCCSSHKSNSISFFCERAHCETLVGDLITMIRDMYMYVEFRFYQHYLLAILPTHLLIYHIPVRGQKPRRAKAPRFLQLGRKPCDLKNNFKSFVFV